MTEQESDIAKRDRLQHTIRGLQVQMAALEEKQPMVHTLYVGSGEVGIQIDSNDAPPELIAGLQQMLQARIDKLEKELNE